MEKIIFTCKTVTPLVMNGASGQDPELRPSGIKAALRFWWRALHGHLDIEDLRKQESAIFGSTKGRSKLLIRVQSSDLSEKHPKPQLLEHHDDKRSPAKAFAENLEFSLRVDFDSNVISQKKIENLFVLSCILGGWGKRSRRGFGSVTVIKINETEFVSPFSNEGIEACLDIVSANRFFISNDNKIESNPVIKQDKRDEYPWLTEIQIGKSVKSTKSIGQATHNVMGGDELRKTEYKCALGAGTPRFASPIVISILPNGQPIVSTLKTVSPKITKNDEKGARFNSSIQTDLKNEILI